MAEDKPFEPTASRIARARREGNVARSSEIATVASFGSALMATFAVAPSLALCVRDWLQHGTHGPSPELVGEVGTLVLVPLGAAALSGALASVVQGGGLVIVAPKFQFSRLQPVEGLKRMFTQEAAIAAARALLAFAIAVAFLVPTAAMLFVRGTLGGDVGALAAMASLGAQRVVASAVGVAALFAVFDYLLVKNRWRKKLRMSFYEVKKEHAENEGNPQMRGKRRSRHRSLLAGPIARVADANFVIANPTHVAVALAYRPPEIAVPRVLVLATEDNALRVRALARDYAVPVVENVMLARELLASATVGRSIPRENFVAVAEIVNALSRNGLLR